MEIGMTCMSGLSGCLSPEAAHVAVPNHIRALWKDDFRPEKGAWHAWPHFEGPQSPRNLL